MNRPLALPSPSAGTGWGTSIARHRVLRNTYALLSMTLLFSAAIAALAVMLQLPPAGLVITLVGYFGLLFLIHKLQHSGWAIPAVFALTGFMGYTLGPVLARHLALPGGAQVIALALGATGATFLALGGKTLDVRVSTLPSRAGERVVLRILDKDQAGLSLDQLGMDAEAHDAFRTALREPNGIILVTGPTGSGKTTSLYAGLSLLNDATRNILTVEDPVEYAIDGVGQTQVNPKVGMTFATGLRAILRQDPDVVMVGEIRDLETAEIAVQASLTGHLVLSTLHTNSAVGAIARLRDMGVEPFLLSSSLIGVLAQRLVRQLCHRCKQPHTATAADCEVLGVNPTAPPTIYTPAGCDQCNQSGYRGRSGIFELLVVDQTMQTMIHEGRGELDLERHARQSSPSIRDDGRRRVLAGDTSLAELVRVTRED